MGLTSQNPVDIPPFFRRDRVKRLVPGDYWLGGVVLGLDGSWNGRDSRGFSS